MSLFWSLFGTHTAKATPKEKSKISLLKNGCSFFSKLKSSCQTRSGNVQEINHENPPFKVSISHNGSIHVGPRSKLLTLSGITDESLQDRP